MISFCLVVVIVLSSATTGHLINAHVLTHWHTLIFENRFGLIWQSSVNDKCIAGLNFSNWTHTLRVLGCYFFMFCHSKCDYAIFEIDSYHNQMIMWLTALNPCMGRGSRVIGTYDFKVDRRGEWTSLGLSLVEFDRIQFVYFNASFLVEMFVD